MMISASVTPIGGGGGGAAAAAASESSAMMTVTKSRCPLITTNDRNARQTHAVEEFAIKAHDYAVGNSQPSIAATKPRVRLRCLYCPRQRACYNSIMPSSGSEHARFIRAVFRRLVIVR